MQAEFIQLHITPEQGVGMMSHIRAGPRAQDAANWHGINHMYQFSHKLKESLIRRGIGEKLMRPESQKPEGPEDHLQQEQRLTNHNQLAQLQR